MTTPEVSTLKAEVASLWQQYRRDDAVPADDVDRRALGERASELEAQRRSLAGRSVALRQQVSRETARAVQPWRELGVLLGVVSFCGLVALTVSALAEVSVALTRMQGGALLVVAMVMPLLLLRRSQ